MTAPGWYNAEGDPPGSTRYWDGSQWVGDAVHTPPALTGGFSDPMPMGGAIGLKPAAQPGSRIGARIIDGIIGLAITVGFMVPLLGDLISAIDDLGPRASQAETQAVMEDVFAANMGLVFAGYALGFLWEFLWVGIAGGTPGKLMVGVRVADADTGKIGPGLVKAGLRALNRLALLLIVVSFALVNLLNVLMLLVGLISLVLLFTDERHRTVMDRIAGTVVVKK